MEAINEKEKEATAQSQQQIQSLTQLGEFYKEESILAKDSLLKVLSQLKKEAVADIQ